MASMQNAHALIIAISNYQHVTKLPSVVIKDARDITNILVDSSLCAYPNSNVKLLLDEQATKNGILEAISSLAKNCDEESTVFVYFSCHGGYIESGPFTGTYLLPFDANNASNEILAETAISGEFISTLLNKLKARKLVIAFDCCHSGGIGQTKTPSSVFLKSGFPEEYYSILRAGRGRVILASSRNNEVSWIMPNDINSLFTKHLLDGLRGSATGEGGIIRIFDLFNYVQYHVTLQQPKQHPIFKAEVEDNFPIALYLGGKAKDSSGLPHSNHNLPPHQNFIDRKKEKARVIEGLISRAPLIKIEGLGGMGKTVLAIEIGYDCLPNGDARLQNPFSYCVFVSAKTNLISLDDLLNIIARELYYPYIYQNTPFSEKPFEVRKLLRNNRVLIIVDNLETITDRPLLEFLQNIPDPSKVIITTRQTDIAINAAWTVRLSPLIKTDAVRLIKDEARAHGINSIAKVDASLLERLVERTGGNPFAIKIIVANMKDAGWTVDRVIKNLENGRGVEKIFEELYPSTWEFLSTAAQKLLLAVSFFSDNANGAALKAITDMDDDIFDQSMSQLIRKSLIDTNDAVDEYSLRFSMHPLTIAFVKKKLVEMSEWEYDARRNWAQWFLNFSIENKGDDWWEGYLENHKRLDEEWKNLLAVFEWCKGNGLFFDLIKEFWLDENVSEYIKTYGHWNDRLKWLQWIMDNADKENREDDYVASVGGIIWTLTRMGAKNLLENAEALSKTAHNHCEGVSPIVLSKYFDDTAVLYSRLRKWEEAKGWFYKAQEFLDKTSIDYVTRSRRECHILFYQADLEQRIGNSEEAKILCEKGLQLAIAGKWQRAVIFFKYRLAYTAIVQNHLTPEIEEYLSSGLLAAQKTKNSRAIALYKMTIARIEKQRGNLDNCRKNGEEALNIFMRLGMQEEITEVEQLLTN